MKGSEFLDAMEWVDPALIEEADTEPIRSRFAWPVWMAGVACLAVLFLGLWVWSHREPGYTASNPTETAQTEPALPPETQLYFEAEITPSLLTVDYVKEYDCRFSETLTERETAGLLPEALPEWANFTGEAVYNTQWNAAEVTLTLEDTPWSRPLLVRLQTSSFDLEQQETAAAQGNTMLRKFLGAYYNTPVYPRVSDVEGLICTPYFCRNMDNRGSTGLFVTFRLGELYGLVYTDTMGTANMAPETAMKTAKEGLRELMTCFARMEREQTPPTLDTLHPRQESEYQYDQPITLEQAHQIDLLGAWMPTEKPVFLTEGPGEETILRHCHPHQEAYAHNYIRGQWTQGGGWLIWEVSQSHRVPFFRLDELTLEQVQTALYGSTPEAGWEESGFTVLCGDVLVEMWVLGVSPEWVYDQLMTLKARNQATVLWNDPAPLVIFSDEVVPYGNASPVPLTPEQLEQCVPANPSHWMVFSGSTLYLSGEQVHSVCLQLPDSTGRNGFTIFIQEAPESLTWDEETLKTQLRLTRFPANGIYEPYETNSPLLTQVEDLVFGVYRHRSQNFTRLWAVFYRNGLQYGLFIEVPTEDETQAGADLLELMTCYAQTQTVPDLSGFPRGEEGKVEPIGGEQG